MNVLGIDLGSSFQKGAVLDLDAAAVRHVERLPAPAPLPSADPARREFDPEGLVEAARALLERLAAHAPDAQDVVVCGQLHGLVLADDAGRAIGPAINWQDQRALQPAPGGTGSVFDEVERRLAGPMRRALGNEPRPGLPLCFLHWLARHRLLPDRPATVASLPGYVVARLCGGQPVTEVTHAHGSGALDVATGDWHRGAIAALGLEALRWPAIVPQGSVVGEARLGGRRLRVHAPVGDYQCSQAGALLDDGELSINVSTGSAVLRVARGCELGDFQTRPWFDGRYLATVTHIPGGRALAALVRLLEEFARAQGVALRDPWPYILAEAERADDDGLDVDPAFYYSAMGDRGAIRNVREASLDVGHLFRAAFAGMADNYARCALRIAPARDWRRIVYSGGVALKTPLLRRMVCARLGEAHRLAAEEDTLQGLLVLAHAGRTGGRVADAIAALRGRLPA